MHKVMHMKCSISPTDVELLNNQGSSLDKCWLVHWNQAHCVQRSLTRPWLGGKPQSGGCQTSPQTVSSGMLSFKRPLKKQNNNNTKNMQERHVQPQWYKTFTPSVYEMLLTIFFHYFPLHSSLFSFCRVFLFFFVLWEKNPTLMWVESCKGNIKTQF